MALKIPVMKMAIDMSSPLSDEEKREAAKALFVKLQGVISDIAMLKMNQNEIELAAGLHFLEMKKLNIPFEKIASIHFDQD